MKRWALAVACALCASDVIACTPAGRAETLGERIAAVACTEHERWYAPFIDASGRLAAAGVSEAEASALRDGTPAWHRVAQYWRNSGVRWPSPLLPEGTDCSVVDATTAPPANVALCRTFLVDMPWSAVFVSYVMTQAGAPGFTPSAAHIDFVGAAHRGEGPFRFADPQAEAPAAGDLLCYVREPEALFGHPGLRGWLDRWPAEWLPMHCDVVVSTHGGHARVVGGNVLHGVTMRLLPINRAGRFRGLPQRTAEDYPCDPDRPAMCNLNRQDWAALLKLDPALKPNAPPASEPSCCTACLVPLPAGVVRCEANARLSP
ncbi:DUF2272 domain-containing protein [Cognatilysobacter bugurensis]|uniref:DUF2272 domain-containing protein n=1 Tax=Cognatilysobacter bugurensis TaxID=543356 RepID=UPI001674C841|nr:DUF2272 domain-containing protein [Lysobacter bugurensis]